MVSWSVQNRSDQTGAQPSSSTARSFPAGRCRKGRAWAARTCPAVSVRGFARVFSPATLELRTLASTQLRCLCLAVTALPFGRKVWRRDLAKLESSPTAPYLEVPANTEALKERSFRKVSEQMLEERRIYA